MLKEILQMGFPTALVIIVFVVCVTVVALDKKDNPGG